MRGVNLLALASTLLWVPTSLSQHADGLWAGWPSCVLDCADKSPPCKAGPVRDCVCPSIFAACYRLVSCKRKDAATVDSMVQPICERDPPTPLTSAATPPPSSNTSSQASSSTPVTPTAIPSAPGNVTAKSPSQTLPLIPSPALSDFRVPSNIANTTQYLPVTPPIKSSLPPSASSSSFSPDITGAGAGDGSGNITNKERSSSNSGAIAGGVIGGIAGLAILVALVLVLKRRTRAAAIERETMRELERDVPEPPTIEDDEVYGYGYGAGMATGYPHEKAHPIHLGEDYGEVQAQQPQYGYGYGYPDEKPRIP